MFGGCWVVFGRCWEILSDIWRCRVMFGHAEDAELWSSDAQTGLGACLGDVHNAQVMLGGYWETGQ